MSAPRASARKFNAPKGMRDFYPQDMAVRRYIEGIWRQTSINHGFDEVEGPTFEDIELYKHKSGPGIVSEIFQVFSGKDEKEIAAIRGGQDAPFALRPEFTPTLARMVAAKAAELPRPIKWFAIPTMFRAERPQRGRLREHIQWNVDFIGGDDLANADAEVIATAVGGMQSMGIRSADVTVRLSHRNVIASLITAAGVHADDLLDAMVLLDKRAKISHEEFGRQSQELKLDVAEFECAIGRTAAHLNDAMLAAEQGRNRSAENVQSVPTDLLNLIEALNDAGVLKWCEFDFSIVRGLAYYTGTVFEIHEATGAERAIAGGGRYDNLIESFGGPALPACGFGMGDVVLANILHDKGLLPEDVYMKPLRPHAFAIAASDEAEAKMRQVVAQLRRNGYHVRHSYKATRNVGKLLGDANKARALSAIIFGKDLAAGHIDFKDLHSGEQTTLLLEQLEPQLKAVIARNA